MLKSQHSTFLSDMSATILSASEASIPAVFDKYFGKRPPFGDGKNKSEFPDAFAIETLEAWCLRNDEKIYIVSGDKGFKNHCDTSNRLFALKGLADFIAIVVEHDEVLVPNVQNLLGINMNRIHHAIAASFCEQGFWIENQEGDVNDVSVNELEVSELRVLEAEKDSAVIFAEVYTRFFADLAYADMDTAIYDSDDRVLIPWRTIKETVDRNVEYTATFMVSFDQVDTEYFDVMKVEIETKQGFGFSVSPDDEWPYK